MYYPGTSVSSYELPNPDDRPIGTAHGWTTSRLASIAASWWSTWPGRNPGPCVCLTFRLEGLQECHFASLVDSHFPTMHVQTMNDAKLLANDLHVGPFGISLGRYGDDLARDLRGKTEF